MDKRGISRIEQTDRRDGHGASIGWYVRVSAGGKIHSRWFSDKKFGGKRKALASAVEWRDAMEQRLGGDRRRNQRPGQWSASMSKTVKEGTPVYMVRWSPKPGRYTNTSISIKRWGEREARRRAREILEEVKRTYYAES
jgi:hypothetical protein